MLGLLGNPLQSGSWDRRGLVVGLVQSGKTSHYIGLVNKAVDAGYKVVVILTGFTESLRVQTQIRAEEGFLGYSKEPNPTSRGQYSRRPVGLGKTNPGLTPDSVPPPDSPSPARMASIAFGTSVYPETTAWKKPCIQ